MRMAAPGSVHLYCVYSGLYSGGGGDTGGTLHGTVHLYSGHSTGDTCPLSLAILMCQYPNTGWMDQANCIMTNFLLVSLINIIDIIDNQ